MQRIKTSTTDNQRADQVLSSLIGIQTVCKGHQQWHSQEKINMKPFCPAVLNFCI